MSDVIIYQGAAIPFSFSRQNGQPLDVTSVMRTLADITTYAANTEKKYVPYEGQTIACLEDKMLYILELKNGVLVPKLSGGVKLIKRDDNVELTDDAAMSALRSVKEIEERAISRTKRDIAAEVIEFAKGLTAGSGKTTVSGDGKITTLNLLVQVLAETYDLNVSHVATMMRTIIKDYVSSEAFTPGLMGEGFKISKAINGDWNLEIDNVVVRKVMTIFEMIISKVRSVNGGLVISPANGRIKSVAETTGSPAYYVIGIEGDMQFLVDDFVRCQVFSNGHAKFYWVRVSSISGNSILVLKSEFTNGAAPAVGDDLVQMGNKTNTARQGLIYLTASEDGKPRISVMDGVNSTSLVGKNKVILGCLDGITDTDFPADFQPSGYGLYAMNVFLKGIFVLRSGKTIESELTTTNAAVTAAKQIADAAKELANSANALLSDIASDNKLTPSEKQATKKEWEQIVSEKVKNDASADKYGVSKVACTTAYNALSVYITPLLASLTTTSDIVGTTFRSTFKAYYDARADLLNSISSKAKDLADAAQGKATEAANAAATAQAKANEANTAAGAAQSTADGAVTNAATANSLLSDIANDNKFTATEKQQTKKEWDVIVSEKPLNNVSAVKFSVSTAAYDTAYNALNTYITPLLVSLSTTSNIVGTTFRSTFKAYYDARTNLLNAVSEKAKMLADDAQSAANAAQAKADTVTRQFQDFTVAGGVFESKITEVKEYADGKVAAVQVGGRNLLEKSSIEKTGTNEYLNYANTTSCFDKFGVGQYVISFDLKLSTAGKCLLYPIHGSVDLFKYVFDNVYFQATEQYKRYSFVVNVRISNPQSTLSSLSFYGLENTGRIPTVRNVKIEQGNKETAWTPAPEDVDAQILKAKAEAELAAIAEAQAKADLARMQASAYADGIVTAEEQRAINDAKAKLAEAKLDAQAKANDAKQAAINDATGKYPTKSEFSTSITQLSDSISLKAEKTEVTALNTRVSAAEANLSVQATQIASKVSQVDFNDLGQRVVSAESAIVQQADQISLKASKSDLNTLSGRVTSTEAELRVHATEIGMKVTAGDVSAGMTITANKITLFGKEFGLTGKITFSSMASDAQGKINDAQNAANAAGAAAGTAQNTANKAITDAANSLVTSRNNIAAQLGYGNYDAMSAAAIAGKTIINGGKIRTELIDATAIVTGSLVASVIFATNITTGRLTVTDNAKIGEFLVQNNSLVNYDFRASLQIGDSDSLRYVKIGGDSLNLAKIQVAGENTVGLNITTYKPTVGRYPHTNYAIKSVGSHVFKQRGAVDQYDKDDIWDAPGVLWCGQYSCSNWNPALVRSWGNGLNVTGIRRQRAGCYTITHNLGHVDYFVHAIGNAQIRDNWTWWNTTVSFFGHSANQFSLLFKDDGGSEKDPAEFQVMIFGRNNF